MILGFILILIVIIPLCIYLYITNKKLLLKIEELEKEKRIILERKVTNITDFDRLPMEKISHNIKPSTSTPTNKPITNTNNPTNTQEVIITKETNLNIEDLYNKESNKRIPDERANEKYLKEISENLNQKETQRNIELTKYEQEEENNAIISYQELNKKRTEKLIRINENDDAKTFIENLKDFRNNLKS